MSVRDFSVKISNLPKNIKEKDIYSISDYVTGLAEVGSPVLISCSFCLNDCLENLLQIENLQTQIREFQYLKNETHQKTLKIQILNQKISRLVVRVSDQKLIVRRKLGVPFGKSLTLFSLLGQPVTSIILTLRSFSCVQKLMSYYAKVSTRSA